jgi:prepilin signal peptidase PulO-like enzyme (type II secretory pathway)
MPYFFFVSGLFVGSFLNVVILRLGKSDFKEIWMGRSRCPKCKKTLKWFELIPVLSFILQGGKCRYCKKPISLQYPLVEFSTGLLFALIFLKFGNTLNSYFLIFISCLLIILFVYDLKTQMIPDIIAYIAIGLALVYSLTLSLLYSLTPWWSPFLAAIVAGGFFAILVLVSKEKWMGQGDIKLGALMGLLLGYPNVFVGLFLAFVLGALVSLVLIALKKKTLKSQIPFGPFLITAIFVTIFYGEAILNWYLGILSI